MFVCQAKTASILLHRVEIRSLLLTHYLKSFMVKWRSLSSLTTNKKKRRRETSSFQFSHSLTLSLIPSICVSYFGKHFNNILRSLRWTRNTSIILIHYRISFAPITLPCTLFSNRVCVCASLCAPISRKECAWMRALDFPILTWICLTFLTNTSHTRNVVLFQS